MKIVTSSTNCCKYFGSTNSAHDGFTFTAGSVQNMSLTYYNTTTTVAYSADASNSWTSISLYRNAPTNYCYYNTTLHTMTSLATGSNSYINQMLIGNPSNTAGYPTFYVAEILIYNSELSTADRSSNMSYVQWKYATP